MSKAHPMIGLVLAFLAGMGTDQWLHKSAPRRVEEPLSFAAMEPTVYYSNCSDARSAGAAPVYSGEPGYAAHLDRDGDGVGCE